MRAAIAVAVANDGRSDGRAMTGTMQQPLYHVEREASGEAKHRSAAQAGAVGQRQRSEAPILDAFVARTS